MINGSVEIYKTEREEKFRQVDWEVLLIEEGEFKDRDSLIKKILDFEEVQSVL